MNNGDNRHYALFHPINDSVAEGKYFPKGWIPFLGDDTARQRMLIQVPSRRHHLGYDGAGVERGVLLNIFGNGLNVGQGLGRPNYSMSHFFRRASASSCVSVPCSSAT